MRLVFDIEGDNLLLDITKIYCIVIKDIDTKEVYTFIEGEFDKAIELLQNAQLLIAHNGVSYDIPVLQKFFPSFNIDMKKVFDTILVSRLLNPDREGGHSLKAWGSHLGFPKTEFTDFSEYTQEMLDYCIQDVLVTERVFNYLKDSARECLDAMYMENYFANYIVKQVQRGFTLDVDKVKKLYKEYSSESDSLKNTLVQLLPPVADKTHYRKAKELNLLLEETDESYTYITEKTRIVKTKLFKLSEPNPTSRTQIIEFLKSKGWTPKEFTDKGTPKIDETVLESVRLPEAEAFARLFRLQKLMGMIENPKGGWLFYERNGRVHGDIITIGASTSRCTHSKPNLAQVDKKDKRMREVWIPQEGWKLVGCDASGLELRILGHYLSPYDKGVFAYKASQPKSVVDLHVDNQIAAGLTDREAAKTIIYALIYGAGNTKLGSVYADDQGIIKPSDIDLLKFGKIVRERLMEEMNGYKQLLKDVGNAAKKRGYLNSIDKRPLYPRSDYSALNLLIQSAGAIIMKQALVKFVAMADEEGLKLNDDYGFVANVHDEFQIECRPEIADRIGELGREAIKKAGEYYRLDVDLDGEYIVGNSWAETH